MQKKGLGFICIGHEGKIIFLDKDTKEIISADIIKGEYIVRRIIRLKKEFPLSERTRKRLISKYNLLTQKR